jgi:hypothetical protein
MIASFVLGHILLSDWNPHVVLILVFLPFIPLVPLVFRYSRVIWMHFDRWVCPGDVSAGPYEKMKQRQNREGTRHEPS